MHEQSSSPERFGEFARLDGATLEPLAYEATQRNTSDALPPLDQSVAR